MPHDISPDDDRRRFLHRSSVYGGALLALGSAGLARAAAAKMDPKAVSYKPTPQGTARCDKCKFWEPPASCKIVSGPIAPSGWCTLYAQKS